MKNKTIALLVLLALLGGCSSKKDSVDITWDVAPKEGLITGDYYKEEERFRQGHLGILEVVVKDDHLEYVYFNEYTRANYYNRYFQNVSKRMSEYNISMKDQKGAAWIEGILSAESAMIEQNKLDAQIDSVAGASNIVEQSMLPLDEKIQAKIVPSSTFEGARFYQLTQSFDDGMIGILKLVVENGAITSLHYDELFPKDASKIKEEKFKGLAGLSKYDSVEYDEPSRIGFNVQMDALSEKVLETQDLFNLEGLPAIESTGDYKSAGYTERNSAWDHYLELAKQIHTEMLNDNIID